VRFSLFDAVTGGSQVSGTVELTYGKLQGGRFAASLDFGPGAFNGEARWLEIQVPHARRAPTHIPARGRRSRRASCCRRRRTRSIR
jgi:hypothetical protein